MTKLYRYVGPEDIRTRATAASRGVRIESAGDLVDWMLRTDQRPNREGLVPITFVVDEQGSLHVADRGSEHIACSGGAPVLSAGEMFFGVVSRSVEAAEITNQSTGFCPEPESWPAVAAALDKAGIRHPGRFTQEVVFRLCLACGQRNIVQGGVCGKDLPARWNFDEQERRAGDG